MDIFQEAIPILQKLNQNGYESFFVGGCVRDKLLNREIGDIDIATSAKPEDVMKIFPKTVPTGLQHGTVLVLENKMAYEITTFRTESTYSDFRRPNEVTFVTSINEDLKRRDFTMNAIAMTATYDLIDPFNGENDIQNQLIKTVGFPNERFQEDALRMMRGIRFVSQLGFQIIDETKNGIKECAYLIKKIAVERICIEFDKILLGKFQNDAIQLLVETELINYLPHFENSSKSFSEFVNFSLDKLKTIEEFWALILYKLKVHNPELILRDWKMSNERIKNVVSLHSLLTEERIQWTNSKLFHVGLNDAVKYERIQQVLENNFDQSIENKLKNQYARLAIHKKQDLCFTGNDLLKWSNRKGGPWLKDLITEIEMLVVEDQLVNNEAAIKEWFTQWLQK